jgi:hypothetical protein
MNNDAIIINYDPFAMESSISIYRNGKQQYDTVSSNLDDLAKRLIGLTHQQDIYSVKVRMPLATTTELKRLISEYELNEYSENKIDVEGI